jgi:hypothetical protein
VIPSSSRPSRRGIGRWWGSLFFLCLVVLLGSGCRGRHLIKDDSLRVIVKPRVISPGSVCQVTVYAPEDVVAVEGLAEIWGSPRYRLKYDADCGCWRGRGMVPIDAMIRPGRYRLRAEAHYADGSWGYASVEIEFK